MNHNQAKDELRRCLRENKTITVPKLEKLMQALNMSLESTHDKEVNYLKAEIKKLNKKIKRQRVVLRRYEG